jgi:hypothetical protein
LLAHQAINEQVAGSTSDDASATREYAIARPVPDALLVVTLAALVLLASVIDEGTRLAIDDS